MLLNQFLKTYNEDNGWFGPEQNENGYLVMMKPKKNPTVKNPNIRRHFELFICDYCKQNAIRQKRKYTAKYIEAKLCSRYSKCYNKHLTIGTVEGKKSYSKKTSRKNPVINSNGYVSWTEYELDKSGYRIKHKSGKGNRRIETFEHRVVVEEHIGRKLEPDECIHHINFNKLNNNIDNLWICNRKTHNKAHASVNKLIDILLSMHIIKFNRNKGKYELDIQGLQCFNTMNTYITKQQTERKIT